jgi:hypothetical protein
MASLIQMVMLKEVTNTHKTQEKSSISSLVRCPLDSLMVDWNGKLKDMYFMCE